MAFAALSMSFLGDGCSLCFRDALGRQVLAAVPRGRAPKAGRQQQSQRGDEEIVWRWAVAKLLRRWALRGRRAALEIFGRWAVAVERRSSWQQAARKAAGPLRASTSCPGPSHSGWPRLRPRVGWGWRGCHFCQADTERRAPGASLKDNARATAANSEDRACHAMATSTR